MIIAHGGSAGAAAELGVFLAPLLVFAFLWWRAARRGRPVSGAETESGPGGRDERYRGTEAG